MADAFISYQRRPSAPVAHLLQKALEAEYQLDIYLDTTRTDSAKVQFPDRLLDAITDSDVFICLLADTTLQSAWVIREIEHAYQHQKPCIPVFQESYRATAIENPAVDYLLSFDGIQIMDQRGLYIDEGVQKIANILKKTTARRPARQRLYLLALVLVIGLLAAVFFIFARPTNSGALADSTVDSAILPTNGVSTSTSEPSRTPTDQATSTASLTPTDAPTATPTPTEQASATPQVSSSPTQPAATATPSPRATASPTTSSISGQSTSAPVYAVVNVNAVNLRNGPSTNFERVGSVAQGTRLQIIAEGGYSEIWYLVQYTGETLAWIIGSAVDIESSSASIQAAATVPPEPETKLPTTLSGIGETYYFVARSGITVRITVTTSEVNNARCYLRIRDHEGNLITYNQGQMTVDSHASLTITTASQGRYIIEAGCQGSTVADGGTPYDIIVTVEQV